MDTTSTTEVGSYFISNYPPFSQWTQEAVGEIVDQFATEPVDDVPLGLYMHILHATWPQIWGQKGWFWAGES